MNLQLNEINSAVSGVLTGPGNMTATGYSIDTRTLNAGDLFFAIKGPNFNGHHFVSQAIEKKAAGVVVEEQVSVPNSDFAVIRVQSSVAALQTLARSVRRKW